MPSDKTKECPFCKEPIAIKATKCPHCQSEIKKGGHGCLVVIALVFIMIVLPCILLKNRDEQLSSPNANNSVNSEITNHETKIQWLYDDKTDDFDNTYWQYCQIDALDDIKGHWGRTKPAILVRKKTKGKKSSVDILLKSNTTFRSNILNDERVRLKFDNEEPMRVGYSNSDDGNLDTIFLSSTGKILDKIKKSKTVTIEFPVAFENGERATFNIQGYSEVCKFK